MFKGNNKLWEDLLQCHGIFKYIFHVKTIKKSKLNLEITNCSVIYN